MPMSLGTSMKDEDALGLKYLLYVVFSVAFTEIIFRTLPFYNIFKKSPIIMLSSKFQKKKRTEKEYFQKLHIIGVPEWYSCLSVALLVSAQVLTSEL